MWVIFGAIYLLAAVCFAWNLYRLIISIGNPVSLSAYDYIRIALCLVLPVVFIAFVTAAIVSSRYIVGEKELKVAFGFLADKYKTSDIDSLVKDVKKNTLTIAFKDESTLNVIISPEFFGDFCAEIMKKNRNVSYIEQ